MSKKKFTCKMVFMCMFVLGITVFTSCSLSIGRKSGQVAATPVADTRAVSGVVMQNDTQQSQLQIRELDTDIVDTLTYGATSTVKDRYQSDIDGSQIEIGQIYTVTYRISDAKIEIAEVPEDVWEYQDVKKFSFDGDEHMMQLAGEKYQYDTKTYFASSTSVIDPMEFSSQDVLTVRGIGIKVYSAVRTSGHGYIRLANYNDFMGGMAEVGDKIIVPIAQNMLITAGEGTYRLTLSKTGASATKTVTVKNDTEVVVDFSDYVPTTKNIGEVTFDVEPEGADVALNGTVIDYSKPVRLNYGKYKVTVSMTGYETYSGVLDVEEASKTISIDLIEADDEDTESTATSTPATSSTSSSDSSSDSSDSSTVTKQIDSDHTITVSAPEGASVYLDNVYKGMAPCTFTKIIGSQTITLSETGYVTKSYSVDILDDDNNTKLSFADLVKDDTVASSTQ